MRSVGWLVGCLVLLAVALASAQAPTPVQSVPSELRASTVCLDTRALTTATLTVPAVNGMSFYVNVIETNATVAGAVLGILAAPAHVASTGLNGATFGMFPIGGQAVSTKVADYVYSLSGNGLKGANSTAVVLTAPSVTNLNWHLLACGYYAP